jgi:fatty acid desaturase
MIEDARRAGPQMPRHHDRAVEWPTVALIAAVYATVVLLVWFHQALPWWIIMPVGGYAAALYTSLQHEVLHGHPTGNRRLNEALIFPTLTFWLPYGRYRDTHLRHHNDADLTDPRLDPESYYMLPEDWAALPGLKRSLYLFNQTLCGRMLIGPAVSIARFWPSEFRDMAAGDRRKRRDWGLFAISAALTIAFLHAAGMPLWTYIVLIAYPGMSLSLVRSYCEHRAAAHHDHRTIIVEASPFWSLLFLNNNLHVAHHTTPALAWYRLPAYFRAERERLIARNDGYTMTGYGEIFRRYFLTAKEPVPYPDMSWLKKDVT